MKFSVLMLQGLFRAKKSFVSAYKYLPFWRKDTIRCFDIPHLQMIIRMVKMRWETATQRWTSQENLYRWTEINEFWRNWWTQFGFTMQRPVPNQWQSQIPDQIFWRTEEVGSLFQVNVANIATPVDFNFVRIIDRTFGQYLITYCNIAISMLRFKTISSFRYCHGLAE